jgi:hypothetical protein
MAGLAYIVLSQTVLEPSLRPAALVRCSQGTVLLSLACLVATDIHATGRQFSMLAGPLAGAVAASVSFGVWPAVGVCIVLCSGVISAYLRPSSRSIQYDPIK